VEMVTPESMVGNSLQRIEILRKLKINVISIKRKRTTIDDNGKPRIEELMLQPSASFVLEKEDILVIIGRDEDIDSLQGE
jgi:Trk K+ transport system NAD-binding subunit